MLACSKLDTARSLSLPSGPLSVKGDRTLARLAEQFDVHPSQITSWKAQLEGGAADVFGPNGNGAAQPTVDVKVLHAKIGELTWRTSFWKERSAKPVC